MAHLNGRGEEVFLLGRGAGGGDEGVGGGPLRRVGQGPGTRAHGEGHLSAGEQDLVAEVVGALPTQREGVSDVQQGLVGAEVARRRNLLRSGLHQRYCREADFIPPPRWPGLLHYQHGQPGDLGDNDVLQRQHHVVAGGEAVGTLRRGGLEDVGVLQSLECHRPGGRRGEQLGVHMGVGVRAPGRDRVDIRGEVSGHRYLDRGPFHILVGVGHDQIHLSLGWGPVGL